MILEICHAGTGILSIACKTDPLYYPVSSSLFFMETINVLSDPVNVRNFFGLLCGMPHPTPDGHDTSRIIVEKATLGGKHRQTRRGWRGVEGGGDACVAPH